MANSAALYTPEVLALATGLYAWPWDDSISLTGEGRSKTCGSAIRLGLELDADGRIERVAVKSQACAIGQAAAAIFAGDVNGKTAVQIRAALGDVERWLMTGGDCPAWDGLHTIAAAQAFPARHAAILLPWRTASEMLPSDKQFG